MKSKEKHEHNLTTIKLIKITRMQKNYKGTAGDKAILVRVCDDEACDKQKAFEMGDTPKMVKLGKELQKA